MIHIIVPEEDCFDNGIAQRFFTAPEVTLSLEHSLIAVSKWEAKYKIPFLKSVEYLNQPKHVAKFLYYIKCMSTKGDISDSVLLRLKSEHILEITQYISDEHSASIVSTGSSGGPSRHPITSERIYALMAGYHVPHEYAKWHLNNLLTVINICAEMNEDPKKRKRDNGSVTTAYYEQNEKMRKAGLAL